MVKPNREVKIGTQSEYVVSLKSKILVFLLKQLENCLQSHKDVLIVCNLINMSSLGIPKICLA